MNVEYTSLERNFKLYQEEYENDALRVLRSGWYILGNELASFEQEFAAYLGVKECIGVGNGTDALILAIRALNIGPGDEVIVPAGAYIASVLGVTENGATPVFVDSDEYLQIDASQIEKKITDRTKAILPVHMYGHPCDMEKIMEIAERHDLYVVEDCAQCHGSTVNGRKTGTFGVIACFSFYPTKPLGALGDAGALVTNDEALAEKLRMLRNYGSKRKYVNEMLGINTRLDEIQSAFLRTGLRHIEQANEKRVCIAEKYISAINNPALKLPEVRADATHSFHLFPVLCEDRDKLQQYLLDKGIKTQVHYPIPPYASECFAYLGYKWEDFPKASYIAKHELSLPIYTGMPEDESDYVIKIVNDYKE